MASPPANDKASMPTTMSRLEIDTITIFMSPGWAATPFCPPSLVASIRAASSLMMRRSTARSIKEPALVAECLPATV
jgi:hypothetical protein